LGIPPEAVPTGRQLHGLVRHLPCWCK